MLKATGVWASTVRETVQFLSRDIVTTRFTSGGLTSFLSIGEAQLEVDGDVAQGRPSFLVAVFGARDGNGELGRLTATACHGVDINGRAPADSG
ncbi:hypothetical protein JCM18920_2546 [Cutibacterium acnes JCM 18920]|nr:hypothetical protein JCM18920_2546 [Cutibacterium acnes JCM 18920]